MEASIRSTGTKPLLLKNCIKEESEQQSFEAVKRKLFRPVGLLKQFSPILSTGGTGSIPKDIKHFILSIARVTVQPTSLLKDSVEENSLQLSTRAYLI